MKIVNCQYERHGEAILAIFNREIATSTSLYDYEPRTLETIRAWFEYKQEHNYPIIGIEDDAGFERDSDRRLLVGFSTYGTFRTFAAYQYSVEHSVYVDERFRGRGIGTRLLEELIQIARQQNYHTLIGAIDAENKISISLHRSLGFVYCGKIEQAGFKFNRWLDLEFYQLILSTADG